MGNRGNNSGNGVPSTDEVLKKYGAKIESQMKGFDRSGGTGNNFSQSYERFKESMLPEFNRYERWCKSFGNSFSCVYKTPIIEIKTVKIINCNILFMIKLRLL